MAEAVQEAPAPVAPASATPAEPIVRKAVAELSDTERREWRRTGERPIKAETPAEPAPAAAVEGQPAGTPASSKPATEPADEPLKPKAQERFNQLLAERRAEKDRADRLERELADARRATPAIPPRTVVPAVAMSPEPDPSDLVKYPFGAVDPKFTKDLIAFTATSTVASILERERSQSERETAHREFVQRVDAAKAKNPGLQEALNWDAPIPAGTPVDLWIRGADAGPEVLHHLFQHQSEVPRILALSPLKQVEELARLSIRLTDPPPVSPTTAAPDLIAEVPTGRSGNPDPAVAALKRHDQKAYTTIMNQRELAAKRGSS